MNKLKVEDLLSLERYARERPAFRAKVLEHKRDRQIGVGAHVTWLFEDRVTMQYQVQEMLRAERIFESEAIAEELESYNPMIPDGSNWKVTLLIEYPDEGERRRMLTLLKGIEDRCWVQVIGQERVFAIADEDLERENDEKTSAVHFLRFELSQAMIAALRGGADLAVGIDHPQYNQAIPAVPAPVRTSLLADLS
jgi:hypothetical protein